MELWPQPSLLPQGCLKDIGYFYDDDDEDDAEDDDPEPDPYHPVTTILS